MSGRGSTPGGRTRVGAAAPIAPPDPGATQLPIAREVRESIQQNRTALTQTRPLGRVDARQQQMAADRNLDNLLALRELPEVQNNPELLRDVDAEIRQAVGVRRTIPGSLGDPLRLEVELAQTLEAQRDRLLAREWVDAGEAPSVAATPVQPGSPPVPSAAELIADERFTTNPLADYFQPAYHFRLLAVGDKALVSHLQNTTDLRQLMRIMDERVPMVTLAQSGVTAGVVIKDVEFESNVGPNHMTFNVNMTSITMTLVEPLGVSFLDMLREAAIALETTDAGRCFYILELTFKAYDEQGNALVGGSSQVGPVGPASGWNPVAGYPNGGRWIWLIQFTNVETKLDSGGSTYTIKAIPYEQQIFDETRYLRMPESAEIAAPTVGSFLREFAEHLNQSWRNRLGAREGQGNELVLFRFETHRVDHPSFPNLSDMNDWALTPRQPEEHAERHITMTVQNGMPTARIAMGTRIADVIEYLFANCEQAHNIALDRGRAVGRVDARPDRVNEEGFRQSLVMRVEPQVTVSAERGFYDWVSSNYMLDVVLHIWPYYTQTVVLSETQRENARDPEVQRKMIKALQDRGLLQKRYDYIFTGKNTEVIDLDIRHNLPWSAVLPKLGGARIGMEVVEPHARLTEASRDEQGNLPEADLQIIAQEVRRLNAELSAVNAEIELLGGGGRDNSSFRVRERRDADGNPTSVEVVAARNTIRQREARERIATLENTRPRTPEIEQQLARERAALGSLDQRLSELNAQRQGLIGRIGDTRRIVNQENQRRIAEAAQTSALVQAGTRVFAEDRVRNPAPNARNVFPLGFRQGGEDVRNLSGTGFTGTRHIDKSLFGAVLGQLYEEFNAYFVNIDLTVRGDPFWLGLGNLERHTNLWRGSMTDGRIAGSATASPPSADPYGPGRARPVANFQNGDVCFLLSFRYPLGINEDTSAPIFKRDEMLNGIYKTVKVRSTFADGEFKQVLSAMKHPLIDLGRLLLQERNPADARPRQSVRPFLDPSTFAGAPRPQDAPLVFADPQRSLVAPRAARPTERDTVVPIPNQPSFDPPAREDQ